MAPETRGTGAPSSGVTQNALSLVQKVLVSQRQVWLFISERPLSWSRGDVGVGWLLLFSCQVVSSLCNPRDCSTPGSPVPRHHTPWDHSTVPHCPASAQNLGHVHGRALVLACGHPAFTDLSCVLMYKKAHTKSFPSSSCPMQVP